MVFPQEHRNSASALSQIHEYLPKHGYYYALSIVELECSTIVDILEIRLLLGYQTQTQHPAIDQYLIQSA